MILLVDARCDPCIGKPDFFDQEIPKRHVMALLEFVLDVAITL